MFIGCGTALVTPFRDDLSLDEETLRRLVQRQIAAGIDFLVPCGTTGESPTLTRAEHLRVVEITIEEAKGKVPVLAGAGGYNTREVIELAGVDIVMMLRLQRERMQHGLVPSAREYFRFFGLDAAKLAFAKPDALVMHPGPMNRGVEIDSAVADDPRRSVISEQVEMGVAVRMAVLDTLARGHGRNEP